MEQVLENSKDSIDQLSRQTESTHLFSQDKQSSTTQSAPVITLKKEEKGILLSSTTHDTCIVASNKQKISELKAMLQEEWQYDPKDISVNLKSGKKYADSATIELISDESFLRIGNLVIPWSEVKETSQNTIRIKPSISQTEILDWVLQRSSSSESKKFPPEGLLTYEAHGINSFMQYTCKYANAKDRTGVRSLRSTEEMKRAMKQIAAGANMSSLHWITTSDIVPNIMIFGISEREDRIEWYSEEEATRVQNQISNLSTNLSPPHLEVSLIKHPQDVDKYIISVVTLVQRFPYSWEGKYYTQIGEVSTGVSSANMYILFPPRQVDFSAERYQLSINELNEVASFYNAFKKRNPNLPALANPAEILNFLGIHNTVAAKILFGGKATLTKTFDEQHQTVFDNHELVLCKLLQPETVELIEMLGADEKHVQWNEGIRAVYYPYPAEALREALANAVAHADVNAQGPLVKITILKDRIWIVNPCYAEASSRTNPLGNQPASVVENTLLAGALRKLGTVELSGFGLRTILLRCLEAGKPLPEIFFKSDSKCSQYSVVIFDGTGNKSMVEYVTRLKTANIDKENSTLYIDLLLLPHFHQEPRDSLVALLGDLYFQQLEAAVEHPESLVTVRKDGKPVKGVTKTHIFNPRYMG